MRGRVDAVRVHARQTTLCLIELTLGGEYAIRSQVDALADSKVSTGLLPAALIGGGCSCLLLLYVLVGHTA
jgi:hypothetical protein